MVKNCLNKLMFKREMGGIIIGTTCSVVVGGIVHTTSINCSMYIEV